MKMRALFRSMQSSSSRQSAMALIHMASFAMAGSLLLGGCNKAPAPPAADTTPAAQSAPAPPPPAAGPSVPAASPAAPAAGPAMAAAPAAAMTPAPPPPPKQYTVPDGTPLVVRVGQTLSAKTNNVGDTFTGTLAQSVLVKGVNVIRAGATVSGTVVAAKGQGRFKGDGALGISIRRVADYSVTTSSYEAGAKGKGKRSAEFIGGGGGGGALIGGLAGGGKGALIGGLLGAGAGTAGAAFTGNKNISIPAETVVTFTLTAPITVTLKRE